MKEEALLKIEKENKKKVEEEGMAIDSQIDYTLQEGQNIKIEAYK